MFKKVLIAEDHEIANISVQKTLQELGVHTAEYVYYCDDAFKWVKNSVRDEDPYDLLITDIEFEDDDTIQTIKNGLELVRAVKTIQPQIKVVILSARSGSKEVDDLFKNNMLNGYVRKARRDGQYLKEALRAAYDNKIYKSPDLRNTVQERNSHEFTVFDLHVVKLLCEGISQKEMPFYLQQNDIKPSSLSSIEKRLNLMKEVLNFTKNEQLVAYCKEIGLV